MRKIRWPVNRGAEYLAIFIPPSVFIVVFMYLFPEVKVIQVFVIMLGLFALYCLLILGWFLFCAAIFEMDCDGD